MHFSLPRSRVYQRGLKIAPLNPRAPKSRQLNYKKYNLEGIGKTFLHGYSKNMVKYASMLNNGNPNKTKNNNER